MKLTNLSDHFLWYCTRIGERTSNDIALRPGKTLEISREEDELIIR